VVPAGSAVQITQRLRDLPHDGVARRPPGFERFRWYAPERIGHELQIVDLIDSVARSGPMLNRCYPTGDTLFPGLGRGVSSLIGFFWEAHPESR